MIAARLLYLVLFLAVTCISCRDDNADSKQPLPENQFWQGFSRAARDRELLRGARQQCNEIWEDKVYSWPENLVLRGQCMAAMQALDSGSFKRCRPIMLYAVHGLLLQEQPHMLMNYLTPNRETSRIHIFLKGDGANFAHLVYALEPKEKEMEMTSYQIVPTECSTWEEIATMPSHGGPDDTKIVVKAGSPLPLPDQEDLRGVVGIENRSGALSNFVPVFFPELGPGSKGGPQQIPAAGASLP